MAFFSLQSHVLLLLLHNTITRIVFIKGKLKTVGIQSSSWSSLLLTFPDSSATTFPRVSFYSLTVFFANPSVCTRLFRPPNAFVPLLDLFPYIFYKLSPTYISYKWQLCILQANVNEPSTFLLCSLINDFYFRTPCTETFMKWALL